MCVVLLPARFARAGRRLLPRRERNAPASAAGARPTRAVGDQAARARARWPPAPSRSRSPRPPPASSSASPTTATSTTDATQRQAYDRLADGLRRRASTGRSSSPSRSPTTAPSRRSTASQTGIAADREVADVEPPALNQAGDTAVITVTPKHGPQDDATRALVDRLRARRDPRRAEGSGATAYVGGRTARFGDEAEKIAVAHPAVRRRGRRALAAAPARRVPLVADLAALGRVQPGLDRRRLRRRRARVPDRDGRGPARRRAAAGRPVRAAVHVRDPVRPLDRLQRVPALARARGVGPARRPPRRDRGRLGRHAQDHHRRRRRS